MSKQIIVFQPPKIHLVPQSTKPEQKAKNAEEYKQYLENTDISAGDIMVFAGNKGILEPYNFHLVLAIQQDFDKVEWSVWSGEAKCLCLAQLYGTVPPTWIRLDEPKVYRKATDEEKQTYSKDIGDDILQNIVGVLRAEAAKKFPTYFPERSELQTSCV